jgi:hypothetical protein
MEVNTVVESIVFEDLINLHAILIPFPHSTYIALQQNERRRSTTVININTTSLTTTIQLTTSTKKQRMSILL